MKRNLAPIFALAVSGCGQSPAETNGPQAVDEWPKAPFPTPGGNGAGGDGDGDGDGDGEEGGVFVPSDDASIESTCDPFLQDCRDGQKCVPYASSGGTWDANKCVDVGGTQQTGGTCVSTGPVESTDDCHDLAFCWEVGRDAMGLCRAFCGGSPDNPVCDEGTECLIAYEGAVTLCLPPESDTEGDSEGTGEETSGETGEETGETGNDIPEPLVSPDDDEPTVEEEAVGECPDSTDPAVFYLSNDDSNSQASPILVRRMIADGLLVDRDVIRIHEFLNYYDLSDGKSTHDDTRLTLQMRRTDPQIDEYTLLVQAHGRTIEPDERPPFNLVFSLDTSGSMAGEPLELLKDSITALAGNLREGDKISLVEWSDLQSVLLSGHEVTGPDDPVLLAQVEGLTSSGSTNLHAGLQSAYALAQQHHIVGGINRVVLVSDGGANTGVTDIDLISEAANDEDGEGTYLVGVGVGSSSSYSDQLMDSVTDAGKGAYVFIDNSAEAELQFGDRFLSNVAVSARDVRMRLEMPWYFGIKVFHGEEYSEDPAEVTPQHLAPNDAMSFHQVVQSCATGLVSANAEIRASVEYLDPLTQEPRVEEVSTTIENLGENDANVLYKADVVVGYAKSLIVIDWLRDVGQPEEAKHVAEAMTEWISNAANALDDDELADIAVTMSDYAAIL